MTVYTFSDCFFCHHVNLIQVATAPGFHLFPFRTEKLSPVTPMVLRNSGRVGRRRFLEKSSVTSMLRGTFCVYTHPMSDNASLPSHAVLCLFFMQCFLMSSCSALLYTLAVLCRTFMSCCIVFSYSISGFLG